MASGFELRAEKHNFLAQSSKYGLHFCMVLCHISVNHFRGIQLLDWHVGGRIVCLVGAGDSTKTAILDAIELVLLPRPFFQFTDADFFNGNPSTSICIEATIGELPAELLKEDKFGLWKRGYDGQVRNEPLNSCSEVLSIRLTVDGHLEPTWMVVKNGMADKVISARDREKLGLVRLGGDVERHLTWARGSALNRLTVDQEATGQMFVTAQRMARAVVAAANLKDLNSAAEEARKAAFSFGADIGMPKAGLDPRAFSIGASALGLESGKIPVRQYGLGTRRLAAIAIQQHGAGRGNILLTDEIEQALEPHRQRHLLKLLMAEEEGVKRKTGQVIFTTHSPTPIMALDVEGLRIVRSTNGKTVIIPVTRKLQAIARSQSLAFLSRKVVVCEGKTEEGVIRSLESQWSSRHDRASFAFLGVVLVDGGGSNAHSAAEGLCSLKFKTALFCDTDVSSSPSSDVLRTMGVSVFEWEGKMSIEERLSQDLLVEDLQTLLTAFFQTKDEHGRTALLQSLADRAKKPQAAKLGPDLKEWLLNGVEEAELRVAFGKAAKTDGWFKNLNDGQLLGKVIGEALCKVPNSSFAKTLSALECWIFS